MRKPGIGYGIGICGCSHSWQDSQYGKQKRVHTVKKDDKWCCTVCGTVKDASHCRAYGCEGGK